MLTKQPVKESESLDHANLDAQRNSTRTVADTWYGGDRSGYRDPHGP